MTAAGFGLRCNGENGRERTTSGNSFGGSSANSPVRFAELRAAQVSTGAGLSRLQVDLETSRSVIVNASSETTNLRIQLMARLDRIQDVAKEINLALVLIREGG